MEKKYGYYMTKSEKALLVIAFLLIVAGIVWTIGRAEYGLLILLVVLVGVLATTTYQSYKLTNDNMLIIKRYVFGNAFKPISVNQITSINRQKKNKTILVYNRNGLRGDIILKLSETDMENFVDELKRRNPTIEINS